VSFPATLLLALRAGSQEVDSVNLTTKLPRKMVPINARDPVIVRNSSRVAATLSSATLTLSSSITHRHDKCSIPVQSEDPVKKEKPGDEKPDVSTPEKPSKKTVVANVAISAAVNWRKLAYVLYVASS